MFVDNYLGSVNGATGYAGGIADEMRGMNWDTGFRRPYIGRDGHPRVTVNTGRYTVNKGVRQQIKESKRLVDLLNQGVPGAIMALNATALRKEEWIELDRVVLKAARPRMRAWGDLAGRNSFGGFNGMSKMVLEHEVMSDPGEAM